MKQHNFVVINNQALPSDICDGCGLTWAEVMDQMYKEDSLRANYSGKDDCELRARKQKLKAFW